MDVSTVGQAAAAATAVSTGSVSGAAPAVAPPPATALQTQSTQATQSTQSGASQGSENKSAIAPAIAKLFGDASPPEPIRLDVSYRVLRDPNEIVTVFSDPKTGQEVAQFPPEILVQIAQFFDQQRGATLDRNA